MAILLDPRDVSPMYHVLRRRLSVPPPAYQSRNDMNPTLLVSWFCTILSLVIIVIRLLGRWVRNEQLFSEDKIMFWSIIPLLARMGFVHVILLWGTNNTITTGLTDIQIQHRITGSKLVLPARIIFATYIWIAKVTVLEFMQKMVVHSWHKGYSIGIKMVYGFLALTYIAVVVSTLAECQPFNHYWQVVPDPGSSCRAGLGQLITMGVCESLTDLVLVIFPIPVVLKSGMQTKRKVSLVLLFLLSLILIGITAFRVPSTIHRNSSQQYRSLMASLQVLASTAVANAIVIGSFLRDKGVKKAKFRAASVDESVLSRVGTGQRSRSKSIAQHHWGSDEDLVRDIGLSLMPDLRHGSVTTDSSRLAPIAEVLPRLDESEEPTSRRPTIDTNWGFNNGRRYPRRKNSDCSSISSSSTDIKLRELRSQMEEPVSPGAEHRPGKMSFFETNETLDSPYVSSQPAIDMDTSKSHAFLADVGGLLSSRSQQGDEIGVVPSEPQQSQSRGLLHPRDHRRLSQGSSLFTRGSNIKRGEPQYSQQRSRSPLRNGGPDELDIADAGGLLH